MQRRQLLQSAGAASFMIAAPSVLRAETGLLRFSVWREGDQIGSHDMRFEHLGDEIAVDITIDLVVKLLFIPVYDYKHTNSERWQSGQLQSFASQTDDNGDAFQVDAQKQGELIISDTLDGQFEHPVDRKPTTYWHKSFLANTQWIDSQKGSTVNCELVKSEKQMLDILGNNVETDLFELTGDLKLKLWYQDNNWVKLSFEGEDGSVIDYRIEEYKPIDISFA